MSHVKFSLQAIIRAILLATLGVTAAGAAFVYFQRPSPVVQGKTIPLPSAGAELLFLDAGPIVQRGSSQVYVVRFVQPVEFVPYYFRDEQFSSPLAVSEWADYIDAPIVFNAGQFDQDFNYLGWLKSEGEWLSRTRHVGWMGLLVSGPTDEGAWGRVVDIEQADPDIASRYKHVMQSMMLFDDGGRIRVRRSELAACRTAVVEDTQGRISVVVTEGAITLFDFATWLLAQKELQLVRAMNLDGGVESQLAIHTPEYSIEVYGRYGADTNILESQARSLLHYPLPAVVAVELR